MCFMNSREAANGYVQQVVRIIREVEDGRSTLMWDLKTVERRWASVSGMPPQNILSKLAGLDSRNFQRR